LPSSKATGAQQIGRLTNLMQLTVDTSWWTRYRSRTKNPDFGDTFPPAVPGLLQGQFPAIPRSDDDLKGPTPTNISDHLQAIANTAGFHFATIEQGGNSLYPSMAQRATTDLNAAPFGGEDFQTNLIMPEPTIFLDRNLPVCSIIRPTNTEGIATGVVDFLTNMGLFIGQSAEFFATLRGLAAAADHVRHGS
jgi:hypothetical protein